MNNGIKRWKHGSSIRTANAKVLSKRRFCLIKPLGTITVFLLCLHLSLMCLNRQCVFRDNGKRDSQWWSFYTTKKHQMNGANTHTTGFHLNTENYFKSFNIQLQSGVTKLFFMDLNWAGETSKVQNQFGFVKSQQYSRAGGGAEGKWAISLKTRFKAMPAVNMEPNRIVLNKQCK